MDETYFGGKRGNVPDSKHQGLTGRGAAGKAAAVGAIDRETNQVGAAVVQSTDKNALQGFAEDRAAARAKVGTDDSSACEGMRRLCYGFLRGRSERDMSDSRSRTRCRLHLLFHLYKPDPE